MSAQEHPIELVIEYARKSGMPMLAVAAERELGELRRDAKGYLNSAITAGDNLVDLGRRNLALIAERDELRAALVALLEAAEEFIAAPADGTPDHFPLHQPTTAADCKLLTLAYRAGYAVLKDTE